MTIQLVCQDCNHRFQAPNGSDGTYIICPSCSILVGIPDSQTSPNQFTVVLKCPTCKGQIKVNKNSAGDKIYCPSCGQKVRVPGQINKTLLGVVYSPNSTASFPSNSTNLPQTSQPSTVPKAIPIFSNNQSNCPGPSKETVLLKRRCLIMAILGFLMIILSIALLGIPTGNSEVRFSLVIVFFLIAVCLFFYSSFVYSNSPECHICGSWNTLEDIGRILVETKKCYGLVTREAGGSISGRYSGTSNSTFHGHPPPVGHSYVSGNSYHGGSSYHSISASWQERVPVIRYTYRITFYCEHCKNTWTRLETNEVEDFEITRD